MIESQTLEIANKRPHDGANLLNALTDEFRSGRSTHDLLRLLNSKNEELTKIGVFITNEICATKYCELPLLSRIKELTAHPNPSVRFLAFGSLFPFLDPSKQKTRGLISRLICDEDEGVRASALAAAQALGVE